MNKYKFNNKQIINVIIISILYVTWIIGLNVVMGISGHRDNYIMYSNICGSVIALIYTIILHYPLIPIFSKYINARTEAQVVAIRRDYAIKALYTVIIGFFVATFLIFLKMDDRSEHLIAASWGLVETVAALMMGTFSIFTIQYWKKMKILVYVDKLQHKNADIED